MTESTRHIIEEILAIPRGRVSSYGAVALRAGLRNGARQVVRVLHSLGEKHKLPWYRIIRADGSIALESCSGGDLQAELLRKEGVKVSKEGRIDMKQYGV